MGPALVMGVLACWRSLFNNSYGQPRLSLPCAYTLLNLPPPMVEPLLCGIVLGLVPITIFGLFVSAYNQYRRQGGMFGG